MKILISADLEGVSGVVHPDQIYPDGKFYKETLVKITKELNAIIDGLKESGIKKENIVISDSHNHMRNLDNAFLPDACVILGWQRPFSMVSQVDKKFDLCFFTGYHGKACSNGVLSHTYRPRIIKDVLLNGKSVGEVGLNATLAGFFNVPVGLVSGDDVVCNEAKELLGNDLVTVEVKKSFSRYSAMSYPFEDTLEKLKEGAKNAVKNKSLKPYKIKTPTTLSVEFAEPNHADAAELIPGVERAGNKIIEYSHEDFSIIFKCFLAMGALAASRDDITC